MALSFTVTHGNPFADNSASNAVTVPSSSPFARFSATRPFFPGTPLLFEPASPFLSNQNPAPDAINVLETANILFRVEDVGEGVDITSVQVSIKQGLGVYVPAVVNGVIVSPFNGAGSMVVAVNGLNYNFTLDPITDLIEDDVVFVRVEADDLAPTPNHLDTTYSFATGPVVFVEIDVEAAPKDGGYTVNLTGDLPDGVYIFHIGPLSSIDDPICYSGVEGQASHVTVVGGQASMVLPPIDETGGPYAFYLEKVSGSDTSITLTGHVLFVLPAVFRSGVLELRRLFLPWFRVGQRTVVGAPYPQ